MPKTYDILIIGAGILGLSCAYHLKANNRDKEILVVDRLADVAQGNTARSAAAFRNMFTSPDNLTLADTSINFYLDTQRSGFDLGIKKIGYLWIMSERQLASNERHVKEMEEKGIDLKKYDRGDLEHLIPSLKTQFEATDEDSQIMGLEKVSGGILGTKCGILDPAKLARFYADGFVRMGGKIALGTNVKKLILEPEKPLGIDGEPFVWQDSRIAGVELEGANMSGEVRAETTVIASGVWNNELLEPIGIDGHVKGKKRQMFTIPAEKDPQLRDLLHNGNFNDEGVLPFVILPKSACFIKPMASEGKFWVAADDDLNREYIDLPDADLQNYKAEPRYYEDNVYRILKAYLPAFESYSKPSEMWTGLYSYNTLDSIPFVFFESGMIVAGGGSGSGIMKGDAMGRLVDAAFRSGEDGEATLYGGVNYPLRKIGFKSRQVEREEWVL